MLFSLSDLKLSSTRDPEGELCVVRTFRYAQSPNHTGSLHKIPPRELRAITLVLLASAPVVCYADLSDARKKIKKM